MQDEKWMREALILAKQASDAGEVPVGCVVVCGDEIVGRGCNNRENGKNALHHAEVLAIDEACRNLGGWRLWHCTLYVTLEPCPMCAGAILNARIPRVVYGAADKKAGACGTNLNLMQTPNYPHPTVERGVLEAECTALLQAFFQNMRADPKPRIDWKARRREKLAELAARQNEGKNV